MSTQFVDSIGANEAPAPEAAAGKPNPDLAGSVRDFFLQVIAAEHKSTRALIQSVTPEKLDFQPAPAAKTTSELMWYLIQAEHHALAGICDGKFEPLPNTPEHKGANAVLAWDDGHFSADFRRLMELSGADLLRPVQFAGATLPAVEYLPLYLGLIQQFRGQLILYLALAPAAAETLAPEYPTAETAEGELSEEDLAAVAGGGGSTTMLTAAQVAAGGYQTITITTTTPTPYPYANANAGTDLGSLFNTGSSQLNQVEGYLVGAAFATVGVVAGGAAVAGAVGVAAGVAETTGTALDIGAALSSASSGLSIGGGFAAGGAVTEGAYTAGQKA